jgi:PAS domain S-box-containing protein
MGRIGVNYSDRDWMIEVLKGKSTISNPVMGKKLKAPLFAMTCPIRDAKGKVIGALWGAITLDKQNFLSKITDNNYGKTGGYLLVSRQIRTIVFATDKNRIMEPLPGPGINPLIDRFIQGYEGTGITVRPIDGVEVLSSAKGIPVSGWYVAALLPTEEAFAPAHALQNRVLLATIFLTLLAGGLTWWMLKRQLAPVFTTIKTLATLADTNHTPQPLPITRQDEIGELIGGFNRLLETLREREEALFVVKDTLQDINDELLATEEMLRGQIGEYETSQKLLKGSEERSRQAEEEFRELVDHLPVVVWQTDERGTVRYISKVVTLIDGYTPEEVYAGGAEQMFSRIHPDDQGFVMASFCALFAEGAVFDVVFRLQHKEGHWIWVHDFAYATTILDGVHVARGVLSDVTERKQAEAERQHLEHQFQQAQKLESLGVLAGGIAHDFNNILTVIMGHCYMVKEDMIPEEEYKAAFQKIETAGSRATDLCRQMLTYAGKSRMEQTRVNLWLLVDEVVKMLQAAIKKNVTIELDLKRDVPEINGDSAQIQQIVMNLIINSADAIGEANGTIRVVLTKTVFEGDQTADTFGTIIKAGRYACLEVTDTGCGMDEATQKRIFEPFFTTKFIGRGLGMSAIHGIIKSHEAILQLTSKPGVGTTFKVYFPVPQPSDYAKTTLTRTVPLEEASGTILMVEDEELLRIMGKELLEAHGFTAMTASNGSESIEIYRERGSEIDVILMDLIMPVMGGIEAYHELRKINPTVPIIICSGYGVESVELVIKNDPHAEFIHKPYKPDELRDMLVRIIVNREVKGEQKNRTHS